MKTKFYTILLVLFCFVSMGWGQTTTLPYTTAGTFSWKCPTGVYQIQVESWGGGGTGGGVTNAGSRAGGGGGGSYVKNTTVNVVPDVTYTITVGAGGAQSGTGQGTAFGGSGGFSGFSGGAVTTIVASGGTGGSGGTTANPLGLGGVLGGMYGITTSGTSTGTWTSGTTTVSITGGGGSGATGYISTSSGAFSAAAMTNMGTGFTSVPTVTITSNSPSTGGGITAVALVNPNSNAGGDITLGTNGSSVTSYVNSGAGGAGANGGAGGASVTGNVVGLAGTAPGGGGSGASTTSSSVTSAKGGVGAAGKVLITYVSSITLTGSFSNFAAALGSSFLPQAARASAANSTSEKRCIIGKLHEKSGKGLGRNSDNLSFSCLV